MFVQLVHIRVRPGLVDEFMRVFRVNFEGTRQEPGNHRFDVLQDSNDDHHFAIYEIFDSATAVDEHRKTEHYKRTVAEMEGLVIGDLEKDIFKMVMPTPEDGEA